MNLFSKNKKRRVQDEKKYSKHFYLCNLFLASFFKNAYHEYVMEEKKQELSIPHRGISHCKSFFHRQWFRVLLIFVAISMIVFGFSYGVGIDILSFLPHPPFILRMFFGVLYMITALFIIHYVFEYEREKDAFHYVCYRCLSLEIEEKENKNGKESEEK